MFENNVTFNLFAAFRQYRELTVIPVPTLANCIQAIPKPSNIQMQTNDFETQEALVICSFDSNNEGKLS
jgi:hypothetical protein